VVTHPAREGDPAMVSHIVDVAHIFLATVYVLLALEVFILVASVSRACAPTAPKNPQTTE
jgi:hypothetical protein